LNDSWSGWTLVQDLFKTPKCMADKHSVSFANVATRTILDQPKVAGVMVGVRLGLHDHRVYNTLVSICNIMDKT
jgi:hypothetical protein